MKKSIISITGFSCTGKSTILKQFVNNPNLAVIRYADIHREAIRKSGYKLGIDWIREKGFEDYERGTLKVFIDKIEKCNFDVILIDGIFSNKCFEYMENDENIKLTNILLETPFDKRLRRMSEREGYDIETAKDKLKDADWLKYYAGLCEIMKKANYFIDSDDERENLNRRGYGYSNINPV